jgi:hypothetical protein
MQICSMYRGAKHHFQSHCQTHHQSVSNGLVVPVARGRTIDRESVVVSCVGTTIPDLLQAKSKTEHIVGKRADSLPKSLHGHSVRTKKWCTENGCDISHISFYQMRPFTYCVLALVIENNAFAVNVRIYSQFYFTSVRIITFS